jgi:hypothetical protein
MAHARLTKAHGLYRYLCAVVLGIVFAILGFVWSSGTAGTSVSSCRMLLNLMPHATLPFGRLALQVPLVQTALMH